MTGERRTMDFPHAVCVLLSLSLLLLSINAQGIEYAEGINPGDIPIAIRQSWCQSEQKTCTELCHGSGLQIESGKNTCDYNQLSLLCECSDGSYPAVAQFSNSLQALTCNWQLTNCLANATTPSTQHSCRYQYLCGGRNATDPLAASSASSSSVTPSRTQSANQQTTPLPSSTSRVQQEASNPAASGNENFAWVAAPVVGLVAIIGAIILFLWWRRRRHQKSQVRLHSDTSSNTENSWGKQELDGSPVHISELHSTSRIFQMSGGPHDSRSELPGSRQPPAELDGSPLPQEMSTVSPRLVRSNGMRSPISPLVPTLPSPTSPYAYNGEVSPATSSINHRIE